MSIKTIDTSLQKTYAIAKVIEDRFGWQDREDQAYDALRAVLHAIRDRLPAVEATAFASQLPLILKGTFYDGWDMARAPIKMNREEFLARIRTEFMFDVEGGIGELVLAVVDALRIHMDPGEIEKIKKILPEDIAILLG